MSELRSRLLDFFMGLLGFKWQHYIIEGTDWRMVENGKIVAGSKEFTKGGGWWRIVKKNNKRND